MALKSISLVVIIDFKMQFFKKQSNCYTRNLISGTIQLEMNFRQFHFIQKKNQKIKNYGSETIYINRFSISMFIFKKVQVDYTISLKSTTNEHSL